jgi:ArsR family transcriptional regulator
MGEISLVAAEQHHDRLPALPQQYVQPLADIFKVLGDPTRLRILHALMDGERCVRDIAETIEMGQSAVSHQLRILRDARLVQFRRDGKVVYYYLADNHVFTLLSVGLEHVAEP